MDTTNLGAVIVAVVVAIVYAVIAVKAIGKYRTSKEAYQAISGFTAVFGTVLGMAGGFFFTRPAIQQAQQQAQVAQAKLAETQKDLVALRASFEGSPKTLSRTQVLTQLQDTIDKSQDVPVPAGIYRAVRRIPKEKEIAELQKPKSAEEK